MKSNWNSIFNTFEFKRFCLNSRLISGQNLHKEVVDFLPNGISRLVVYDRFLRDSIRQLIDADIYFEIAQEPQLEHVRDALRGLTDEPIALIAIGGGSTMDFAKAIKGFRMFPSVDRIGYDTPRDQFEIDRENPDFHVAIPTTVSSGSESSRYMVLFDEGTKTTHRHWGLVPNLVILDPTLPFTNSSQALGIQLLDSWTHAYETFISTQESSWLNFMTFDWVDQKIRSASRKLARQSQLNTGEIAELQFISFLNGILISHTRTGALHTVGEGLSSVASPLSHPSSLLIASKHYWMLTPENARNTSRRKDLGHQFWKSSEENLKMFEVFFENVTGKLELRENSFQILHDIVRSDKVLWQKEHPAEIEEEVLTDYLEKTHSELLQRWS